MRWVLVRIQESRAKSKPDACYCDISQHGMPRPVEPRSDMLQLRCVRMKLLAEFNPRATTRDRRSSPGRGHSKRSCFPTRDLYSGCSDKNWSADGQITSTRKFSFSHVRRPLAQVLRRFHDRGVREEPRYARWSSILIRRFQIDIRGWCSSLISNRLVTRKVLLATPTGCRLGY